jgi:hypothetical protein
MIMMNTATALSVDSPADHKRDDALPAGAVQSPGFAAAALDSVWGGSAGPDDRLGFLGRGVGRLVVTKVGP